MGGVGKTVIATWLVQQNEVRAMFDQIVWVTLGQTPNLDKCQSIVFLQLTGQEMSRELTAAEILQSLQQAFAKKTVLLVLDDVWEDEHIKCLDCIDDSTTSKVLLSSRNREMLAGGTIVDIELPTNESALQILMNEAGLDVRDAPAEAAEVLKFCNNLPLALGIAGSLLKSMSMSNGDWSGVGSVLKSEFDDAGHGRSMENSLILASLKGIKSSQHAEIVQLLDTFALVPEDTACPLDVLGMLFAAVGIGKAAKHSQLCRTPPRLLLRKWLKILIDRCLILGTVDGPQLHDIVLEFVCSRFQQDELRSCHRAFILLVQQNRPANTTIGFDTAGWSRHAIRENTAALYVYTSMHHHMFAGLDAERDVLEDERAIGWLQPFKTTSDGAVFDLICTEAMLQIGVQKVLQLAERSAASEDWWDALVQYSVLMVGCAWMVEGDATVATKCITGTWNAALHIDCKVDQQLQKCVDRMELRAQLERLPTSEFITNGDAITQRINHLITTEGVKCDYLQMFLAKYAVGGLPNLLANNVSALCDMTREVYDTFESFTKEMEADPQVDVLYLLRIKMVSFMLSASNFECSTRAGSDPTNRKANMERIFGKRGVDIMPTLELYDHERDHRDLTSLTKLNYLITQYGHSVKPLLFMWGDVAGAQAALDWHLDQVAHCIANNFAHKNDDVVMLAICYLEAGILLGCADRTQDVCLMSVSPTYAGIEENVTKWLSKSRLFGLRDDPTALIPARGMALAVKYNAILYAKTGTLSNEEALVGLPKTAKEYVRQLTMQHFESTNCFLHMMECALLCWPALAYEKMGMLDLALEFAEEGLNTDLPSGGSYAKWGFAIAQCCKGRVLAKMGGRQGDAFRAFEEGAAAAREGGCTFFEAVALRDWKNALAAVDHGVGGDEMLKRVEEQFAAAMEDLGHGCKEALEERIANIFIKWP